MNAARVSTFGIVTLLALLVGGCAEAATVSECEDKIDKVSISGTYNADTATIAGLNSKLEGASLALVQEDFAKALGELEAFQTKVTQLREGPEPKISEKDAVPLLEDVGRAIDCVRALIGG
jgi:PBP1b-binding outer membrane lipoprotein LpoB